MRLSEYSEKPALLKDEIEWKTPEYADATGPSS
jgi:hypothetical protein